MNTNTEAHQALIRNAYDAFNKRDIDGVLQYMRTDVQWPNGWEGGYVHGHNEVREYWTRQWNEVDPKVTPVAFADRQDGGLEVAVQQLVKDKQGNTIFNGLIKHVYTIQNGLIERMEIEQA